ncbi:PilZ domain-containing protein [Litoribrevibacter albus]|uniref:PilZ domain-containing protein n=1 Tax=Litoribrevibacter albus TaxID=1473156 RepID=A0AA37W5K2_9GAMM|nr:PilZ domain-containing protein [Litoribrevibacter albus]GLQ31257.1 hypothetical protein GCM10007876_17360 [Litoribrevibacter albus]
MQQSLRLTVPKVHASDQGTLYSDPHELALILRNLPFADMPSAVMKSVNILSVINRSQVSYQLRLKLMLAFDVPYGVCHLFYTPQCPEQLGIIRSRSLQEQDAFREFTQEMSYGYKEVLMDALAHNDKKRAFVALFASFYYMSTLLMLFYSVHQIQPLNIWGEMHRLYKLAEEMEWTRMPQKYITLAKGMTLEWLYKKSLLMFTADPYHMETAQNWMLNHYLSKWSYCADLIPYQRNIQGTHFDIDLSRNDAVISRIQDSNDSEYLRTLLTDNLVNIASKHIDQLHHGIDTHSLGFILNPNRADAEEVLDSALNHWGQKFKRGETRSRCTVPASMTMGLYHCHKDLSKATIESENSLIDVQLIDSSPHGCCLRVAGNTQQEILIGQLVVIHLSRTSQNQKVDTMAGIIRWVAQDKYKGSKVGIKFIPGIIRTGFIRSLSGSDMAQKTHPAVVIVDQDSDRDYSIITSPHLYLCGRTYELTTIHPQRRYLIKASSLLNHTRSLDHFKFHAAH